MTKTPGRGRSKTGPAARPANHCAVFSIDHDRVRRGRDAMLPEQDIEEIAETFKVLAHPTRIRIIRALTCGELCVCELSEVLRLSVSATSHQLHLLRSLRLVRSRPEGKLVHYSLSDPFVVALLDDCTRHVAGTERRR